MTEAGTESETEGTSTSTGSMSQIDSTPPVADFSYDLEAGRLVVFTNKSYNNPASYSWDFGDGGTSKITNPTHTYTADGTYTVILTAKDSAGNEDIYQEQIAVTNFSESASFTYEIGGFKIWCVNTSTTSGTPQWTTSDGQATEGETPVFTFQENGQYQITLKIGNYQKTETIVINADILLEWQDNSGNETGFKIYHSLDGDNWSEIDTVSAGITSIAITEAEHGINITDVNYFKVTAYNATYESDPTNEVSIECVGV